MSDWKEVEGWFNEEGDRVEYRRLLEMIPDGSRIIEIGTFKGRSLASVSEVILQKQLYVIGVDTFGSVPYADKDVMAQSDHMLEIFVSTMYEFGLQYVVSSRLGTSIQVAKELQEDPLKPSLVFIDGDHSYPAVKADIEAWWPLIKEGGGILCGHDYGGGWEGVKRAVDEFVSKLSFEKTVTLTVAGELWSVRK